MGKANAGCHSELARHLYWHECIQMSRYRKEGCSSLGIRYTSTALIAVEAGCYSDVVECRALNPADRVRSPVGENVIWIFLLSYYIIIIIMIFFFFFLEGVWGEGVGAQNIHVLIMFWVQEFHLLVGQTLFFFKLKLVLLFPLHSGSSRFVVVSWKLVLHVY